MKGVQHGWSWCRKCSSMFFAGDPSQLGPCPATGSHDPSHSGGYALVSSTPGLGQSGWRWCHKCGCLFFSGDNEDYAKGTGYGQCAGGGVHDPSRSGHYSVLHYMPGLGQQGWRWCRNCGVLFFAGRPVGSELGRCHAEGRLRHDFSGSGPYSVLQAVPDFAELVGIPTFVNSGVAGARQRTMLRIFGVPGPLMDGHAEPTATSVLRLLETRSVGSGFNVRAIRPAVAAIERVLNEVRRFEPDLVARVDTIGTTCCRRIPGTQSYSNHSWGIAIDITIDGRTDTVGDDRVQFGLLLLRHFFWQEQFFWGVDFRAEDGMHFEASDELVNEWHRTGALNP